MGSCSRSRAGSEQAMAQKCALVSLATSGPVLSSMPGSVYSVAVGTTANEELVVLYQALGSPLLLASDCLDAEKDFFGLLDGSACSPHCGKT